MYIIGYQMVADFFVDNAIECFFYNYLINSFNLAIRCVV
jgi:hypothetical protein